MSTISSHIFLRFKPLVFVLCLLPLAFLVYGAFNNTLGINPVEAMTRKTGDWTYYLLLITLSITPLRKFLDLGWLIHYRRMLGLFVFFYGSLHLLTYVWFDQYFDVADILRDIVKRPFITLGMICWLLLVPLAITSNQAMIKRLKKNWARLHKLVYVIAVVGLVHHVMMIKADYQQPLILGLILCLLLGSRWILATARYKKT
ncbi:MAG: sulfoxide reductase heme-binding subunit YedZ [Gammaproteobacteria bacterium]|nr:sulfoxide reductase heme-binding subunit YedZ [Gammaproteobacteria bacterium]